MFERVELDVGMHGRFYVNLDGRRGIQNPHRDNALCRVGLRTARFSFQTRVLRKAPSWFFEKSFYHMGAGLLLSPHPAPATPRVPWNVLRCAASDCHALSCPQQTRGAAVSARASASPVTRMSTRRACELAIGWRKSLIRSRRRSVTRCLYVHPSAHSPRACSLHLLIAAHRCCATLHWLPPQNFMKMQESRDIAAAIRNPSNGVVVGAVPPMAVEPKQGVHNAMLFSHGPEMGLDFKATMTALHFTDPLKRDPDMVNSNDRVHKSFFYGSKHIDFIVPKVAPHPRLELMSSKKGIWSEQMTQPLPVRLDMYETTNKAFGY